MMIGKKSGNLEPGYVYAPYIPINVQSTVVSGSFYSKNDYRKRKINKIFDLGLDIEYGFIPSKSISSRYATKIINNSFYGAIEIKKPT